MPLGLHWPELIILVGVALLIFGPKRLPEMGSAIGKTIKEFQRSLHTVTDDDQPEAPAIPPPTATQTTVVKESPAPPRAAAPSETAAD